MTAYAITDTVSVNNWPAVQLITGTVHVDNNVPTTFVSGNFIVSGVVGITGSLQFADAIWASGSITNITNAFFGSTGSSGTSNSTGVVSGSQLSGSTFHGYPLVAGGVFFASGGGPAYVTSLKTDVSGALYVTTSGSIPVTVTNAAPSQISTTPALTIFTASLVNSTFLNSNTDRRGATFANDDSSDGSVYLRFGAVASPTAYTVKIKPGSYYEVPFSYVGRIDGIWDIVPGTLFITELT